MCTFHSQRDRPFPSRPRDRITCTNRNNDVARYYCITYIRSTSYERTSLSLSLSLTPVPTSSATSIAFSFPTLAYVRLVCILTPRHVTDPKLSARVYLESLFQSTCTHREAACYYLERCTSFRKILFLSDDIFFSKYSFEYFYFYS